MWGEAVDKTLTLYGAKGSGSVAVEGALRLLGLPYQLIDAGDFMSTAERAGEVNPMKQQPTLVLPSGEVMTESAAILLWLGDAHPEAGLAPRAADPARAQYLRWMIYVPAAIYSLFWVADDPSLLVAGEPAGREVQARCYARIADCWRMMDQQVRPGPFIVGARFTLLDLYVAVVSRWSPGRRTFYDLAPKLAEVVRRVDADPRLAALWADRFPFDPGWER